MVIKFIIDSDGDLVYKGDAPTTTSQAMDISIAKWKTIISHLQSMIDSGEPYSYFGCGSTHTCGLCMMFFNRPGKEYCEGCPIFEKTGIAGCDGTPYEEWANEESTSFKDDLIVAKRELEFLQQLKYDMNL